MFSWEVVELGHITLLVLYCCYYTIALPGYPLQFTCPALDPRLVALHIKNTNYFQRPWLSCLLQRLFPLGHLGGACGRVDWVMDKIKRSGVQFSSTLRGDEVSILTRTYPHKPLRKIKWVSAITRLTVHFTMMWPDV